MDAFVKTFMKDEDYKHIKYETEDHIEFGDVIKNPAKYGLPKNPTQDQAHEALLDYNRRVDEENAMKWNYSQFLELLRFIQSHKELSPFLKCMLEHVESREPQLPLTKENKRLLKGYRRYNTIGDALKNILDTDIVVSAFQIFIVCKDISEFNSLMEKLSSIDIECKQLLKSDTPHKLKFMLKSVNVDVIQKVRDALVLQFPYIDKRDLTVLPYEGNQTLVIVESIMSTHDKHQSQLGSFVGEPPKGCKEITAVVEVPSDKQDPMSGICYLIHPLMKGVLPINMEKDGVRITNYITIVNGDGNNVKVQHTHIESPKKKKKKVSKEERASDWVNKNPPKKRTALAYYNEYKEYYQGKHKGVLLKSKFNDVVETEGYTKSRTNKGYIWVSDYESDNSDNSDSECE